MPPVLTYILLKQNPRSRCLGVCTETTWATLWPRWILVAFLQSCVSWLGYRLVNDTIGATPGAPPRP